ncbi:hypothetical protein HDV00_000201 [Rhizophlyctis rosea]|nr:hypothetical protein HDV00_000201 [Rhizophlyctis rosea]
MKMLNKMADILSKPGQCGPVHNEGDPAFRITKDRYRDMRMKQLKRIDEQNKKPISITADINLTNKTKTPNYTLLLPSRYENLGLHPPL